MSRTAAELLAIIEEQKGQLALALAVLLDLGFSPEDFYVLIGSSA